MVLLLIFFVVGVVVGAVVVGVVVCAVVVALVSDGCVERGDHSTVSSPLQV